MGVFEGLQNEQNVMIVIPKVYSFLLRKNTLFRILYWKQHKVVSIVVKDGNR